VTATDWPTLDYAICWSAGPADDPLQSNWYSITDRTEGQTTITRGKQYELDQVQPGEMTFTLRNDDGAFDPTNASSPFWPKVVPYRLCRLRAQYPATSNRLTPDQATASFATKGAVTTSTLPQWVTDMWGSFGIVPRDATTNAYNLPASVSWPNQEFLRFAGMSVEVGATYTAQLQFTAASSVPVYLQITFWDKNGGAAGTAVGSTVTGTSGTLTVTGTAPAGTFGASFSLFSAPQGGANPGATFYKAGWEQNNTASAWATPGTWYSMFTGYTERWPQGWDQTGNYGTSDLTAVDRFTWLANRGLKDAAFLEALSQSPWRFAPLNEASGATGFADLLGLRNPATIYTPRSGVYQTLTAGNQLQAGAGATAPAGIDGPVVTFTNAASQTAAQLIDLTAGGTIPTWFTSPWTRVFAFRAPTTAALASQTLSFMYVQQPAPNNSSPSYLNVYGTYDGSGNLNSINAKVVNVGTTVAIGGTSVTNFSDGKWHLVAVAIQGNTLSLWVDGATVTISNTGTFPTITGGTDSIGGQLAYATRKSTPGVACDMAFVVDYQALLTNTQVANLYQAFQYGWGSQSPTRTESSDVRYQRLLNWAGVTGTPRISAGASVLYGPAVDVGADTKLLDALQAVVDTEAGQHYVGADGQVVFQSRRDRVNTSPTVTFGENPGEIAYTNAATDFDPTLVVNDATASAVYGPAAEATSYRVTDSSSQTSYGDITASRTVNTLDNNELLASAQYMIYENRQPLIRLEALPVDVGNNPTYWPTLLGLDLGATVKANRRPSNAPALAITGFLEQINWVIDDQRHATWTAQASNSALHQFGQLDSATYGLFNSTLIFGY